MNRKNQIRRLAAENNITIAKLAVEVGVQPHTLRRYTRHEAEPKLELAEKLAQFFDVSVANVLGTEIAQQKSGAAVIGITEDELLNMPPELLADLQTYLRTARWNAAHDSVQAFRNNAKASD